MDKEEKNWKNQSIVILNNKIKRPIALEVLVQEQKLKPKRMGRKNINLELDQAKNSDIKNRVVCPLWNRPVKIGVECVICIKCFHYNCEETTEERVVK